MIERKNIAYWEKTLVRAGFGFVSYEQETHNQRWLGRGEAHGFMNRDIYQRRGNAVLYSPSLCLLLNSSGRAEIFVLE